MPSGKSISAWVWSIGFLLEDCSALFSCGETSGRSPIGFNLQWADGPTPGVWSVTLLVFSDSRTVAEFAWTVGRFPPQTIWQVVCVLWSCLDHHDVTCCREQCFEVASSEVFWVHWDAAIIFWREVCVGLLPGSACDHKSCNLKVAFWFFEIVWCKYLLSQFGCCGRLCQFLWSFLSLIDLSHLKEM